MSQTLSAYGVSISLPDGWYGEIYRDVTGLKDTGPNLHFANTPLILGDRNTYLSETRPTMRHGDAVVAVVNLPSMPQILDAAEADVANPFGGWSLKGVNDLTFHGVATGKSSLRKSFRVGDRLFDLVAFFGVDPPPSALVSALNGILATVRIADSPSENEERLEQYFSVEAAVRTDTELREAIWARDGEHASASERAEHAKAFGSARAVDEAELLLGITALAVAVMGAVRAAGSP